jgi:hypothetical protein
MEMTAAPLYGFRVFYKIL